MNKFNAKQVLDAKQNWLLTENPKLYEALYGAAPTKQIVDHVIYAAKSIGNVSSFTDIFKPSDTLYVGLTNLANAQLRPDEYFALIGIQMQYAVAAGTADANVAAASYGLITDAIKNGEFSLTCDKRIIVDACSNEVFATFEGLVATGDTNAAAATPVTYTMAGNHVGLYLLDSPKILNPQEYLKMEVKLAAATGQANAALKVCLWGAKIVAL